MTHKIFNADDKAIEEASLDPRATFKNHRERMLFDWNTLTTPILRVRRIPVWNGQEGTENPVTAFVEAGRWLAVCDCGGWEYVTVNDPIFFCHECGNKSTDGKSRPVIFPSQRRITMIENALMKRELEEPDAIKTYPAIHRSRSALYVTKPRDWKPKDL